MKRILASIILMTTLFLGLAGSQPAQAAYPAVTLSAGGWSVPEAGSWDPTTGTAVLLQEVAGLTIDATGLTSLTVEGSPTGRVVGAGSGYGVTISGSTAVPVTVKGLTVQGFSRGIYVNASDSITLEGNTISGCGYGIYVYRSPGTVLTGNVAASNSYHGIYVNNSAGCTLTGNTANGNGNDGIRLLLSGGSALTGNACASNGAYGLVIDQSGDNTLSGNTLSGNGADLRLDGRNEAQYIQAIDTTNTVSGKPIVYLVGDTTGAVIDSTTNAGVVYLINCSHVTVKDLAVSRNHVGVLLWNTSDSRLENISAGKNTTGIWLRYSSNNTLAGNNTTGNSAYGIYLEASSGNTLQGNTIGSNTTYGLFLSDASNNTVYGNSFAGNWTQALVSGGSGNVFSLPAPIGGNYWSNFTGPDADGDGFIDTPPSPYTFSGGQDDLPLVNPPQSDAVAPATTASLDGLPGNSGWYRSDVVVTLTAVDNQGGTGVRSTEYSLDGVNWQTYAAPFTVSAEGVTTLEYRSIDIAGNVEPVRSAVLKIDQTAPVLSQGAVEGTAGLGGWYTSDVTVGFTAVDSVSGLANPDDAAFTLTASGEGEAVATGSREVADVAGNVAVAGPLTFKIDRTPPVVNIVTPEPYAVLPVGTALDFGAADALSGTAHVAATLSNGEVTVPTLDGFAPLPGVYTLVVQATDRAGNKASDTREMVIYDATGGFVTGGGWLTSVAGAYLPDPSLTGKVSFGFVSKYHKSTPPKGQAEFRFRAADLDFHSTAYDWLVVAGNKVQFKGTGTINGHGTYDFQVVAIDGQPDCFRITITNAADGAVIYDNGLGNSSMGSTTHIQGSIIVHKGD